VQQRRHRRVHLHLQRQPPELQLRAHERAHFAQLLAQVEVVRRDLKLAGLNLREVEDVVDEVEQQLRRERRELQVAPRRGRQRRHAPRQVEHAQDAAERRAQLVREGRDEDVLGVLERLGRRRVLPDHDHADDAPCRNK